MKRKQIKAFNTLLGLLEDEYFRDNLKGIKLREHILNRFTIISKENTPSHEIKISMSDSDLHDLNCNQSFDWTFTSDTGLEIDVIITKE